MKIHWLLFLGVGALVSGSVGCASAPRTLVESGALTARTLPSTDVSFTDFDAIEENGKLVLFGALRRRDGLHRAFGGHVDLAVLDSKGETLAAVSTNINPRSTFRARESYFKVSLDMMRPEHGTAVAAFHVPDADWNDVQFDCRDNRAIVKP